MKTNNTIELKILKTILWIYIILCLVIAGLNYGYSSRATPSVAAFITWFWHFLTLGFFDSKSLTPLDFTLQLEKPLKKARHRKDRFKKQRDPKSAGAKRIHECHVSKITNGLDMLKRALKQGFRAKYVLVDRWFNSHEFVQTVRGLGSEPMHLFVGFDKI